MSRYSECRLFDRQQGQMNGAGQSLPIGEHRHNQAAVACRLQQLEGCTTSGAPSFLWDRLFRGPTRMEAEEGLMGIGAQRRSSRGLRSAPPRRKFSGGMSIQPVDDQSSVSRTRAVAERGNGSLALGAQERRTSLRSRHGSRSLKAAASRRAAAAGSPVPR